MQVEWSVLQLTLYGIYCTAGGEGYKSLNGMCYSGHYEEDTAKQVKWYCRLNGVCYCKHNLEDTAQMVDSCIAA